MKLVSKIPVVGPAVTVAIGIALDIAGLDYTVPQLYKELSKVPRNVIDSETAWWDKVYTDALVVSTAADVVGLGVGLGQVAISLAQVKHELAILKPINQQRVVEGKSPIDRLSWIFRRAKAIKQIETEEMCRAPSDDLGGCFLAGTKILLGDGSYKNIEDVQVDDQVVAFNLEESRPVNSSVLNTFVRNASEYYIIQYEVIE